MCAFECLSKGSMMPKIDSIRIKRVMSRIGNESLLNIGCEVIQPSFELPGVSILGLDIHPKRSNADYPKLVFT